MQAGSGRQAVIAACTQSRTIIPTWSQTKEVFQAGRPSRQRAEQQVQNPRRVAGRWYMVAGEPVPRQAARNLQNLQRCTVESRRGPTHESAGRQVAGDREEQLMAGRRKQTVAGKRRWCSQAGRGGRWRSNGRWQA